MPIVYDYGTSGLDHPRLPAVSLSELPTGFNERTGSIFNHVQYPPDVVCLVVLWRIRYKLSFRDLAEMFLDRGVVFTHEAVRE